MFYFEYSYSKSPADIYSITKNIFERAVSKGGFYL